MIPTSSFAGWPDEDPRVKQIIEIFTNEKTLAPELPDFHLNNYWDCLEFTAVKGQPSLDGKPYEGFYLFVDTGLEGTVTNNSDKSKVSMFALGKKYSVGNYREYRFGGLVKYAKFLRYNAEHKILIGEWTMLAEDLPRSERNKRIVSAAHSDYRVESYFACTLPN